MFLKNIKRWVRKIIKRERYNRDNNEYNRKLAKEYAEKYAENPNTLKYPYYEGADCANFISQVLAAGGLKFSGNRWDAYESWFCNSNNPKELHKVSITWRAARYFQRHWGKDNHIGKSRAYMFKVLTIKKALDHFEDLYSLLKEGDVVQYGDPNNGHQPYHTQVVHDKGHNFSLKRKDLFMAQHTKNKKDVSLYRYLEQFEDKDNRRIYIYKIKND